MQIYTMAGKIFFRTDLIAFDQRHFTECLISTDKVKNVEVYLSVTFIRDKGH